jgi:dTDP-4-amino-4,6-dideoxygalactose transaminase
MRALNIGPGDEVIVPVFTFAATVNAPLFCGARPVLAEIDERTLNVLPQDIQNKLTNKTKAIIVVHYAGQPCDMREITELAEDHRIPVVEDCAHSLGAQFCGRQTGTLGIAGCFSFYATKNMTTAEGGMITTDDKELTRRVRLLREHGMTRGALEREHSDSPYYDIHDLGYNYRLTEIQAALGMSQLGRVNQANNRRIQGAEYYKRRLAGVTGIRLPCVAEDRTHVFHLYVIRVIAEGYGLTRDQLFSHLSQAGIGLSVHYTPIHRLTFYRMILGYKPGDFPTAERVSAEVLSLPLFPTIANDQMDFVCTKIGEAQATRASKNRPASVQFG